MVVMDGETKVAQYGQWDGYPSGQGVTIQQFLKKYSIKKFKEVLQRVKFIDEAKQKEIDDWLKTIGVTDGWMNMEQAEKYHAMYPLLTRDNGAAVLFLMMESVYDTIWLHDSSDFASDSLFCEWAYVLDLDKRVLEIHKGFNKTPVSENSRFANQEISDNGYCQVAPFMTFTFAEMKKMSANEFVETCNKLEEVEEED